MRVYISSGRWRSCLQPEDFIWKWCRKLKGNQIFKPEEGQPGRTPAWVQGLLRTSCTVPAGKGCFVFYFLPKVFVVLQGQGS